MPLVNIGYIRTRNRMFDIPAADQGGIGKGPVNSGGFGTDSAAEARTNTMLAEADPGGTQHSYWKAGVADPAGGDVIFTTSGGTDDNTEQDPWAQITFNFAEAEISVNPADEIPLFEIGASAGGLSGTDPAGNDGTNLYSRKRIGGSTGIAKTQDIQLEGRIKFIY